MTMDTSIAFSTLLTFRPGVRSLQGPLATCRHRLQVRACAGPRGGTDAVHLARMLARDWSNKKQHMRDPKELANIHVCFRPLPYSLLDGVSMYVESSYEHSIGLPYKVTVVRIVPSVDGKTLELENWKIIKDPEEYWMGAYERQLLDDLTRESLIKLPDNCNTIYEWNPEGKYYQGYLRPKKCIITRKKLNIPTYLESNIVLKDDYYQSWDIGRDVESGQKLWGPEAPFEFYPLQNFADEVEGSPNAEKTLA
eukprot:Plantae.Rhodophyta-Purpureofilum_apyrenoidigerum.ctg10009.p1 GENE.Plantae.Rhodophyta-Purpureofilum_apyrenoidigerum.ctg10009~~Plantae.Rhodophyta-Purpureofilum_apyrenoidigerum.ctg10009.p1  ORF type:complete len:252 (-),score=48.08 Plantae.Rhodophyta-Purpureofilum_apyrenoidigerum.ctg10009:321-1076(-)